MLGLGFIRIIFMLAVLDLHNNKEYKWNHFIFNGDIAVRLSFVVSGFYMEMVYPKYKNFILFLISRMIRVYPCYFLNILAGYYFQKKIWYILFTNFQINSQKEIKKYFVS